MITLLLQGIADLPWTTWGPVGTLAALMFYFYRQDRKASEEKYNELARNFRGIVEENTKAITMLTAAIESQDKRYGGA